MPAQAPGRAALIGLVHGDVQADVADGVARGGEPAAVAEFGEDRDRRQLTDPVVAHQRLAAGLVAGVRSQLAIEHGQLAVERVDQPAGRR